MKRFMLIIGVIAILFAASSCADSKTFVDNQGNEFEATPYGWADKSAAKYDTVMYSVSVGNVICSVIFSETLIVPIWLTGWELFEPVRMMNTKEYEHEYGKQ